MLLDNVQYYTNYLSILNVYNNKRFNFNLNSALLQIYNNSNAQLINTIKLSKKQIKLYKKYGLQYI